MSIIPAHHDALVEAARAGSDEAFACLVGPLVPRLIRLATAVVGDRGLGEDAVQDALIAAWRALPTFRGDAALATWLHTIVLRSARRVARRHASHAAREHQAWDFDAAAETLWADPSYTVNPAELVGRAADNEALGKALAALPLSYREVLVLHDVEAMPASEVAEVMGAPLGTTKSRIRRARAALVVALSRVESAATVGGSAS